MHCAYTQRSYTQYLHRTRRDFAQNLNAGYWQPKLPRTHNKNVILKTQIELKLQEIPILTSFGVILPPLF